jgi:DNA polymerase-3 subunit delta
MLAAVSTQAPVTLVVGPESLLAERAVAAVVQRARQTDPEVDVSVVAAADLTAGGVAQMLSPSLFAASRVAVVEGLDQASDELGEALVAVARQPPQDSVLVLVHPGGTKGKRLLDALKRVGVQEERCDPVRRPEDQVDFVVREVRRHRGRIDPEAATRLVEVLGGDLRALASMAEQLVADGEGQVSVDQVSLYAEGRADVKGWTIADHAVAGRADLALTELRWALAQGTDAVLVVGALASSLRTLARLAAVPRGYRDADVARDLSVPPWKVRLLRGQLRGWTSARLAGALQQVAAADLAIKGGSTDQTLVLTTTVLAVADSRG